MADTEGNVDINLASTVEMTSALLDQLGTAFADLKAHNIVASNDAQWNDIECHFRNLESVIKKKLEELEVKEKDFTERESRNNMILAEREAAVRAKEQDLLDKVQELKDVAVAAISEARTAFSPEALDGGNDGLTNGNKLSGVIPSVPILKAYLKEIRRNSQGNGSIALQNDYNTRELEAIRTVIGCVEEYKLEVEYPLHQLYKRLSQLDKSAKGDRKRTGESSKQPHQQHKKPRSDGRFQGHRGRASDRGYGRGRQGPPLVRGPITYAGPPQRYTPIAPPTTYTYPAVATQPAYGTRASDPRMYYYAPESQVTEPYTPLPPTYNSYMQPPRPPYM